MKTQLEMAELGSKVPHYPLQQTTFQQSYGGSYFEAIVNKKKRVQRTKVDVQIKHLKSYN